MSDPQLTLYHGYCHCGCGERTSICRKNDPRHGYLKGEPMRFIHGHAMRLKRKTILQVVWEKIDMPDGLTGCWLWTGSKGRDGYGYLSRQGRSLIAHRVMWQLWNEKPVPTGLELDHLCRVRGCVNPMHLEPVTRQENVRRGLQGDLKTHCPQGHAYTPENTYRNPKGWRDCRTCRKRRRREYYEMERAAK